MYNQIYLGNILFCPFVHLFVRPPVSQNPMKSSGMARRVQDRAGNDRKGKKRKERGMKWERVRNARKRKESQELGVE